MNRFVRSSVLLAACVGLWSCTNDPTGDLGGTPTTLAADPGSIFVDQGDTTQIEMTLLDEQGATIPASYVVSNTSANIEVFVDEEFLPEYDADGNLVIPEEVSRLRVSVIGVSAASTSFTVTAGGVTTEIPVRVVPTSLSATFSELTPDIGENLVVTMPAGLTFDAEATFTFAGAADPFIVDRAVDGTSVTLLVAPGTNAPLTIDGVHPDFAPDVALVLSTSETITATSTTVFVGSDDTGTAPEITIPAVGGSVSWYDIPATSPQYYKFVLATATTLTTTINWEDAGGDIDIAWYDGAGGFLGYFGAGTGAHPEVSTHAFDAGTYFIGPEIYSGSPGGWYSFTIEVVSEP